MLLNEIVRQKIPQTQQIEGLNYQLYEFLIAEDEKSVLATYIRYNGDGLYTHKEKVFELVSL